MTGPTSAGQLLLAYLATVPTARDLFSGVSGEEIQLRQARADELSQQISDLAAQPGASPGEPVTGE